MGYYSYPCGCIKLSPLKLKQFQLVWDCISGLEEGQKPKWFTWFFYDGNDSFRCLFDTFREGELIEFDHEHGGRLYEFEDLMIFLTPFAEDTSIVTTGEDNCRTEYEINEGKLRITFTEIEDIDEIEVEEFDDEKHDAACRECEEYAATHDDLCYDCALECTSGRELTHETRVVSEECFSRVHNYADPYRKWAFREVDIETSLTTLLVLMELGIESGLRTWMTSEVVKFLKYPLQVNVDSVKAIRDKLDHPSCKLSTSFEPGQSWISATHKRGESIRLEKNQESGQYKLLHIIHNLNRDTNEENYAVRQEHVLRTAEATCSSSCFIDMVSSYVYHGGVLCGGEADYLLEYLVAHSLPS